MPTMSLTGEGIKKQIQEALKEDDKSELILKIVTDLQGKLEEQHKMITGLVAMISKMYQNDEINKETFGKLDDFLKPYYG